MPSQPLRKRVAELEGKRLLGDLPRATLRRSASGRSDGAVGGFGARLGEVLGQVGRDFAERVEDDGRFLERNQPSMARVNAGNRR